ncbi:hypothetical protein STRCI_001252 [Streptomyces cinnabarinus]|uniref:Uncharacterized protein n=1 Tax=Streptomyces cinnabarinus TaxID=67287 RepID=A0ABY7K7Q8_9ACTN|nr:hypothetical protein [Streptomyces cinnabarinus]WAZ20153.1 hypothetical protein STRCI_001252 [Streptomyces cinnabarinus]
MARHDPTELAKTAYTAYGRSTGGKNYRGQPMPAWDDLGPSIHSAWEVAAEAIARKVLGLDTRPRSEG